MRVLLILAALLTGCATGDSDRSTLKEELKREILAELHEPPPERTIEPTATGKIEGRILLQNAGVLGCRVKLGRLLESSSFLGMSDEVRQGATFDAVTDADGRFVFHDVPRGAYRRMWQPPGDSGWIRRLRDKPDARVEVNQTTRIGDIDLGQKPVGTVTR